MPKPGATGPRAVFGPVLVTGALAVLAVVAGLLHDGLLHDGVLHDGVLHDGVLHDGVLREGWLLPWLLLGLTAGYALSGSA